jgi:hypothetical protein
MERVIREGRGCVLVDLDGTLIEYHGQAPDEFGPIVPLMLERIEEWLKDGYEVRIFTARASVPEHKRLVEEWVQTVLGLDLAITCCKDYTCVEIWDDRAVQVRHNTGKSVTDQLQEENKRLYRENEWLANRVQELVIQKVEDTALLRNH